MAMRRRRHHPGQIVKKLRDADAMLNVGKSLGKVLQVLEVSEATYHRWRDEGGRGSAAEGARVRERAAEEAAGRGGTRQGDPLKKIGRTVYI